MESYQQRVIDELESLNQKILGLTSFIEKPTFQDLHQVDRDLLLAQQAHMTHYARILDLRVARFKPATDNAQA